VPHDLPLYRRGKGASVPVECEAGWVPGPREVRDVRSGGLDGRSTYAVAYSVV
jgi:hypothetical protein